MSFGRVPRRERDICTETPTHCKKQEMSSKLLPCFFMNTWTFARVFHIRFDQDVLLNEKKIEIYLETLIDLIASIKLLILKRYQDGQLTSSPDQSLEVMFDQLVTQRYSTSFIFLHTKK